MVQVRNERKDYNVALEMGKENVQEKSKKGLVKDHLQISALKILIYTTEKSVCLQMGDYVISIILSLVKFFSLLNYY